MTEIETMAQNMNPQKVATLGEVKALFRSGRIRKVFVWCNWQGDDGDYIEVTKSAFLRSIGADVAFHRDGRHPDTEIKAEIRYGDELYIC